MQKTRPASRIMAAAIAFSMFCASLPLPALAGMVSTEEVASTQAQGLRAEVLQSLQRDEVRQALAERGVAPEMVAARVGALTDAEVLQLKSQIDAAPAGASDIIGVLLTVFVILLVTDILGLTKVFPFTRSIR
jgi:hypothetical protein